MALTRFRAEIGEVSLFPQKLGRLSRTYADKSLQMAAADLIDLYEAKSLDGDTLHAIATTLFGIAVVT